MQYCSKCVLTSISPTPATFDENGVCSACRVSAQRDEIDWEKRERLFADLVSCCRTDGSNYDCIVPVSGGKDSYFQTHLVVKEYGLKPLLVTYHGNNYLPVGERNLFRMREVFDCDHLVFRPGVDMLKKINRLCFHKMGDMNWHAHCGIMTVPIQVAVRYRVPLIVWGEHGFMDLGGMFSHNDFVEFTAKTRLEHALRGYDWGRHDRRGGGHQRAGPALGEVPLRRRDRRGGRTRCVHLELLPVGGKRPRSTRDRPLRMGAVAVAVRPHLPSHLELRRHARERHPRLPEVRQIRLRRGTDHACKDIRAGRLSREEGMEMVRRYDHVKSRDLGRWLECVGMSEVEFDRVADTFRDSRVWRRDEAGGWVKDNLWDR